MNLITMNYAESALRDELATLRNAQPGQRNMALNRAAYALGQLVGGGLLGSQAVTAALADAATGLGLSPAESRVAIESGLRAGQQQPRRGGQVPRRGGQAYRPQSPQSPRSTIPTIVDPQSPQSPQWQAAAQTAAQTALQTAQAALQGSQAAAYAAKRALSAGTLMAWGCGAGVGPNGQQTLCWPLYGPDGHLSAIRHRILGSGRLRYMSATGSRMRGSTAGMPLLWADRTVPLRTIAIVEGEINAMSVWQAAHPTGLDVVSLGSESAQAPQWLLQAAKRYGAVLIWLDAQERATALLRALGAQCGIALHSPDGDANDGLRAGWLGLRIWQARLHLAQQQGGDAVQRLCWQYWDVADALGDDVRDAVRAAAAGCGDALW